LERFSFASNVAFVPRGDLLERVTVAPLTAAFEEGALIQAAIFRFAPGGRLRRHPGTYRQIVAVLDGSGAVSGADGIEEPVAAASSGRDPHFQPRTRPACSIHLCISGPCASSRVFTLT
jgi:hypothetical protein